LVGKKQKTICARIPQKIIKYLIRPIDFNTALFIG
jgi:hypothetical protein